MSTDNRTLFDPSPADVAFTTDDWYTPRWLFDAAGLTFDMDVCAPVDPSYRTCPASEYLTVVEDGLTAPWRGLVWMNPPYSRAVPWVQRFTHHPAGLALFLTKPTRWIGLALQAADAVTLLNVDFHRPSGALADLMWSTLLIARGDECVAALARIAAADKQAQGAYHIKALSCIECGRRALYRAAADSVLCDECWSAEKDEIALFGTRNA